MRYVLIVLWLLLGPGYYVLAKKCKQANKPVDESALVASTVPPSKPETIKETPCPRIGPFAFNRGSADIIITKKWKSYKDSIVGLLTNEKKVQIVGLQFEGESSNKELAKQRAFAISSALGLPEESLQLYSSNESKPSYKSDCKIPGARVKLVTVTEKIKEIKDRTLIYFPYNSTNKLNDKEVETYLDALASKVLKTKQQIRLTGHTDAKGETDYNLELGQSRAEVIKNYLISKNVPADKIITLSKGETEPIADNESTQGRAQNRRTELEIIN